MKSVFPEFTKVLASLLDSFLDKASPFWIYLSKRAWHLAETSCTRLSRVGIVYMV